MVVNPSLVELVRPGCDQAIDRALHDANPASFHKRIAGMCPFCLTITDRFKQMFSQHNADSPVGQMLRETLDKFVAIHDKEFDDAEG